jgi:hypothetical protein
MRTLVRAMLCVLAILASEVSRAEVPTSVPSGCDESASSRRAYLNGYQQGQSLVARAWLSVNNCDQLEHFSDIVTQNLDSYVLGGTSSYVVCRYTGVVDGSLAEVDSQWLECGGDCCNEGLALGELAAEMYCQLSIMLHGLAVPDMFIRRAVHTCGYAFQGCCDSNFIGISRAVPLCLQYTDTPYFDVWDETRVIQCAYTPPDPVTSDDAHP